jgi:hypothetical protein
MRAKRTPVEKGKSEMRYSLRRSFTGCDCGARTGSRSLGADAVPRSAVESSDGRRTSATGRACSLPLARAAAIAAGSRAAAGPAIRPVMPAISAERRSSRRKADPFE